MNYIQHISLGIARRHNSTEPQSQNCMRSFVDVHHMFCACNDAPAARASTLLKSEPANSKDLPLTVMAVFEAGHIPFPCFAFKSTRAAALAGF
jgi:hypothetical protein